MADHRKKTKMITWVVIGLMGMCVLITTILPGRDRNNPGSSVTPAVSSATPVLAGNEPTNTLNPPAALEEHTPTAIPVFPYACIPVENGLEMGTVTSVIDGDTIHVNIDGQEYSVRYIGIDAPERDTGGLLYEQASQRNSELVAGRNVILVRDESETDTFGRLLRYVLAGDTFVNLELVRGGYAEAKAYPPDTACHETFKDAEPAVRSNEITLPTDPLLPTAEMTAALGIEGTTAAGPCPNGCTAESPGCSIKGNISMDGEKIYHLPGMSFYADTVINPAKGERWFCTEAEAAANGWRKAKR